MCCGFVSCSVRKLLKIDGTSNRASTTCYASLACAKAYNIVNTAVEQKYTKAYFIKLAGTGIAAAAVFVALFIRLQIIT